MAREAFEAFTPFAPEELSQAELDRDMEMTRDYLRRLDRRLLTALFEPVPLGNGRTGWRRRECGMSRCTVLLSVADCYGDGKRWLHVSLARRDRMPSYEELAEVKEAFVGPRRQAVMVMPRRERHVNLHPYCLHLWCCLDTKGDGLPDFGRHGTI
jgi:hypothetical protein